MSTATVSTLKNVDTKYTILSGVLTYLGLDETDASRFVYKRDLSSVNTVGFKRKKLVREKWIPKNPKVLTLRPPRKPKFNPPRLWPLKEIKLIPIKPDYSDRVKKAISSRNRIISLEYQRYVARFILKRVQTNERRKDYIKAYKNRMLKFEMYSVFYESVQRKLSEGILKVKRVRYADKNLPDHPLTDNQFWMKDGLVSQRGYYFDGINLWLLARNGWNSSVFNNTLHTSYLNSYLNGLTEKLNAKTTRKLVQKLSKQDLHVANVVGERAQTMRMLGQTMKRLKNLATAKGITKTTAKELGLIGSNATLEFQFGWKPLLSDIYALYQLLGKLNSDPTTSDDVVEIRSNSSLPVDYDHGSFTKLTGPVYGNDATAMPWRQDPMTFDYLKIRGHHSVSYVLRYKVKNPALYQLQQLGLVNPLEVAWEVLPWSFALDWIISIGNSINSMSAEAGLEFINGTRTETTFYELDYEGFVSNRAKPFTMASPVGPFVDIVNHSVQRYKRRTLLTTSPVSNIVPSFKNPISTIHGVEGLALFLQRLLK